MPSGTGNVGTSKGVKIAGCRKQIPGTGTVIGYVFVCCHLPGELGTAELPARGREKFTHSPGTPGVGAYIHFLNLEEVTI